MYLSHYDVWVPTVAILVSDNLDVFAVDQITLSSTSSYVPVRAFSKVRTPDGPRQRTLCYVVELNSGAQAQWLKTIEVFNEQGEGQQPKLFPADVEPPADDPQVARVRVDRVRLERTRQFGACWLGWELWKCLGLDGFSQQALDSDPADVPWSKVAAALAIICQRLSTRMELALQCLQKTIAAGRLKDRNKMERRLGKIQARHSQVTDLFEVALRDTPEGVRLFWEIKKERKTWRDLREGAYMLRTNLIAGSAEELWSKYMQLTEAEASFRALKSELSIRPLFHQKEPRVKAHGMVVFLGYALWVTLKHALKRRPAIVPQPSISGVDNAQPLSPMKALALLSSLQSADIVLPTTDGREIRLRRVTEPTTEQKSLLRQLGLSLPERLNSHPKCSADSAIA
jgi:hypothetical protein